MFGPNLNRNCFRIPRSINLLQKDQVRLNKTLLREPVIFFTEIAFLVRTYPMQLLAKKAKRE